MGWGESLPGTAQRSEFIDVCLTRPPLWHNWRSHFPSHCVWESWAVPQAALAPLLGQGGVVKQLLHWECQALSVKIPGGCIREVGFYWPIVSSDLTEEMWAEMFPPLRAEPRVASLCWQAQLEVSPLPLCFTSLICQRCCNILEATCSMYSRYFYILLSDILWWLFYCNGCSVKRDVYKCK